METLKAIHTRRSIRKFKPTRVSEELIDKILGAAMQAPSAGNQQPWHFIVINDRELLKEIPKFSPFASMAKDAPVAILVCGDLALEKYKGFWVQDCSAAVQNMLLAAHDLNLGAVWTAAYPMEDRTEGFRLLCGLPKDIIPLALVVLGYPEHTITADNRFRRERVHLNKW